MESRGVAFGRAAPHRWFRVGVKNERNNLMSEEQLHLVWKEEMRDEAEEVMG